MQEEIVRELIAEMRAKLAARKPETLVQDDASILLFSNILATFTREPALPEIAA